MLNVIFIKILHFSPSLVKASRDKGALAFCTYSLLNANIAYPAECIIVGNRYVNKYIYQKKKEVIGIT